MGQAKWEINQQQENKTMNMTDYVEMMEIKEQIVDDLILILGVLFRIGKERFEESGEVDDKLGEASLIILQHINMAGNIVYDGVEQDEDGSYRFIWKEDTDDIGDTDD